MTHPPSTLARHPTAERGAAWRRIVGAIPGIVLAGVIAAVAAVTAESPWLASHGLSALTLAIVIGMVAGHLVPARFTAAVTPGVSFAKQRLLRLGVMLYGFRLTFQDLGHVGPAALAIDAIVLGGTFALACYAGPRWFGVDRKTSMLVGAGSAICGAAAVMATAPVVRARAEEVAVAVSTVVVFGTVAIFLYPAIHGALVAAGWTVTPQAFGIYVGSTVHEVAQVVAAGRAIGDAVADPAVVAKMGRVMMLAPFLILLSAVLARGQARDDGDLEGSRIAVPWFAIGFVAIVAFHSFAPLSPATVRNLVDLDTVILAMAMAALGFSTHLGAIRRAGVGPALLAAFLFAWLVVGGGALNLLLARIA